MIHTATGPKPIDRAAAKHELTRIDEFIKEPLLLIGGLAVQQYHEPRDSHDIDLVCTFDTANRIIRNLYPTKFWRIENQQDEHRPRIIISHKISNLVIHFGPKITERGEYPNLSWSSLNDGSARFRTAGSNYLNNIRVPSPHGLAYTKLISFISRYENREKALRDMDDFSNLSNHDLFSLSGLHSLILRHGAQTILSEQLQKIFSSDRKAVEALNGSCLSYFLSWWPETPDAIAATPAPREPKILYYAAPHRNIELNDGIASYLEKAGFSVKIPYNEVLRVAGMGDPDDPSLVRSICIDSIASSQGVVIDVDHYGLDTAWEMGYAEGLGKFVAGLNHEISIKNLPRMVNRRRFTENFMHGWATQPIFKSLQEAAKRIEAKVVYLCGSFANPEVDAVRDVLSASAKRLIFPKDYVPADIGLPRDYPLSARASAINQISDCEVLLALLPRYGMDSAWQIGYATAKGKEIIGLLLDDDRNEGSYKSVWDHWMHGWYEKDMFTGRAKLAAALDGYINAGLI